MLTINVDNKIILRSYIESDAVSLFEKVNNSRQHLSPWLSWVNGTTKLEHSAMFIQESIQKQEAQEALSMGIFYDNDLIGGIGMHLWEQDLKKAQIGYWLVKNFEGQGIINKCLQLFIGFLFEKLKLNKLEIRYIPSNKRSAKVAQRLGFIIEGILRQSHLNNGLIDDLVITGLLVGEWKK